MREIKLIRDHLDESAHNFRERFTDPNEATCINEIHIILQYVLTALEKLHDNGNRNTD